MLSKGLWDKNNDILKMDDAADSVRVKMKVYQNVADIYTAIVSNLLVFKCRNDPMELYKLDMTDGDIKLLIKAIDNGGVVSIEEIDVEIGNLEIVSYMSSGAYLDHPSPPMVTS